MVKFGGSSLATPARIRDVGRIVLGARRREPIIAVVSAFQGVTDQLIDCARVAERGDSRYATLLNELARRHRSAVGRLSPNRPAIAAGVDKLLA